MQTMRPASERGHFKIDWLESYHSFSFGEYRDPRYMQFGPLCVINHDFIQPERGFGTHGHKNMEIITYVLKGTVAHKDSLGNQTQIKAHEVQVMSAGRGILHSEFNPSSTEMLELLQIWIRPQEDGLTPGYQQKMIGREQKLNHLALIAGDSSQAAMKIHQRTLLYACLLESGKSVNFSAKKDKKIWIQVAFGRMEMNGQTLVTGDGLAIEQEEKELSFRSLDETDFLLFEMGS